MKVLHYVDESNLAWMVPWIALLKELRGLGVENVVICRSGGTLSDALDDAKILNFSYDPVAQWLPQLTRDLGEMIDRLRPDIIHTRLSAAAYLGGYWGKRKSIPVISTFDKYPKAKYYKNADVLVGCSTAVTKYIKTLDLPRAREIVTILNPIVVESYVRDEAVRVEHRARIGLEPDDIAVIGMGRFVDWKGWDYYLRAIVEIPADIPKLKFILVGSGEEGKSLRALAEELGVRERVSFYPFTLDVRPWLWASDIFVQPSYEPEGFSLMLVEAMAAGLAPIATNIGGSLDVIKDGENGLLVNPRDATGLRNAIISLLDPEMRKRMAVASQNSLDAVRIDRIAQQTLELYRRSLTLGKFID